MDRRKIDVVLASVLILVSLIILTSDNLVEGGMETELGSLFLPRIVAVFMLLFSATIGIQSFLRVYRGAGQTGPETIATEGLFGVGIYLLIFIAYWLAVPYVGFMVATPFVMFSIALLLGGRSWVAISLMSIITPVAIYFLCYRFLRVFLPTWSLS